MQTIAIDSGKSKTADAICPTGIHTISIATAGTVHTYGREHAGVSLADFLWDYLRAGFVARRDGQTLVLTYSNIGNAPTLVEWSRA